MTEIKCVQVWLVVRSHNLNTLNIENHVSSIDYARSEEINSHINYFCYHNLFK